MLTPEYLEKLPSKVVELYNEASISIIANMAERLSKMEFIPSAEWQYKKLIEMGYVHEDIIKELSKISGIRKKEIEKMMLDAGIKTISGLGVPIQSFKEILQTGIETTNGLFENLTRTTASTASRQFEQALDKAWFNVGTGAMNYNTAIQNAITELADKGLASVKYPSGHTEYLEVAVRRAVVTGINQTAIKINIKAAEELQTDLVDVTAHSGARDKGGIPENHAMWQGKRYSISGNHAKFPSLAEGTGYGTGEGLGGWNCRHGVNLAFEGEPPLYTQEELDEMSAPKIEYNGKMLTEYEATQRQRYIERQIRKYKRRFAGLEAGGQPAEDAAVKLRTWQEKQKDFIKQTGLKRQYERENVVEFGRDEAKRVGYIDKRLKSIEQDAIIKKQSENPKRIQLPDEVLKATVNVDFTDLQGVVPKGANLTNVYVMAGDKTSVPIRDLRRLKATYGGEVSKWQKKSGDVFGENFKYVVHWYEVDGVAPEAEFKLKGVKRQ